MKTTKIRRLLSVLLACLFCAGAIPLSALTVSAGGAYDGFIYGIYYGEAYINGYSGESSDVVIPSEINGYTVTNINYSAFYNNTVIESVTMPDTITNIGEFAFSECTNLKSVTLSKGISGMV